MKGMKKLLSVLVTMALTVSLMGCSSSSDQGTVGTVDPGTSDGQQTENDQENAENNTGDTQTADGITLNNLPESLDNPDISIVYWYNPEQYKYDTSKNENVYDPILEAIPVFEEKYGGKVNVIYSSWGEMLSTVVALQKSGEAPDLFEVYDETMYSTILSGVAGPVDDYVSDVDYNYYDVDRDLFSWEGNTYAIPLKPYAFYIMFNRDLFDLEGLKAPDELYAEGNWNWTTFAQSCKALTKTMDGAVTQLGYGSYEDTILSFMYANGGSLLDIDTKEGTVKNNLNAVETQDTLTYLSGLKDSIVYGNDMWGWFDNGTMGMIRGHEYPVDFPFEVGMVPFPTGDDYEGKNLVVYPQGMGIPTGALNPQGAVAFMRVVNELQKAVGDKKEANRIGQENYDMIYADEVKMVYAYDKGLDDANTVIATIVNYMGDGVPAATIDANMESEIQAQIDLMYGK